MFIIDDISLHLTLTEYFGAIGTATKAFWMNQDKKIECVQNANPKTFMSSLQMGHVVVMKRYDSNARKASICVFDQEDAQQIQECFEQNRSKYSRIDWYFITGEQLRTIKKIDTLIIQNYKRATEVPQVQEVQRIKLVPTSQTFFPPIREAVSNGDSVKTEEDPLLDNYLENKSDEENKCCSCVLM
jgi:hypothetical protein